MWKALCFLFSSLCLHFASVKIACGMSFARDWFDQPLLTSPIRLDELDGAMIAKVVREETCIPLLYPKVVSVFDWMDRGDCRMITLDDLVKNPIFSSKNSFNSLSDTSYLIFSAMIVFIIC